MTIMMKRIAALCGALLITAASAHAASILAAPNGMTLYVFAKDENSVSSCYDDCAKRWPPFLGTQNKDMPADWKLEKRADGTLQWLYKGAPTYFYYEDTKPGDMKGEGLGNVWSVIRNVD